MTILSKDLALYGCLLMSTSVYVVAMFTSAHFNYIFHSKGLDAYQTTFAVKKYKSHHHVGLPREILALMWA